MNPRSRRRLRWAVPLAVIAGTALVTSLPRALPAGADPVPVLPVLTPAQLLDKVRATSVDALSGDVTYSTNLGLPDLGSLGVRTGSALDLLTGTHTAHVWYDGAEHVRLGLDAPQAETHWIRNGTELWSWDSTSQAVKHVSLPAQAPDAADPTDPADPTDATDPAGEADAAVPAVDPVAAAGDLLAAIDPTTAVSVRTPGYVAGRPVYELVVSPRSELSTIAAGVVSVDAATGLPLAVRIEAKGATSPAVQIRFTSISFDRPAASVFAFTPPPGATVTEATDASQLLPFGTLGRGGDGPRRAARSAAAGSAPSEGATPDVGRATATAERARASTVGSGWETVAIASNVALGRQFQSLFASAPSVTVNGVTGHVLTTRLINVLVLDDGRLAVGAVTPAALQAAVAGA